MHKMMFAVAMFSALTLTVSAAMPKQYVQKCSASEWLWDTFVGDLGCSFS